MNKTMIAMILVGGKGSRLEEITKDTAKPAVSFGAKYRLIDFSLSNIANSNIEVVGVVTQYEPYDLMTYIGSGTSWDLDIVDGGIHFLTPYARQGTIHWQKGTAHAIKQYFSFIQSYHPDYILILSGDQIYKMDYQLMFMHHLNHNADITIASTRVAYKDTFRFGILETDDQNQVLSFEEKPTEPKSNLASMGLYLFSTKVLEQLLFDDPLEEDIDFGKNVIPKAIEKEYHVSTYEYTGYWKDVGTIESLFEANMDLIDHPEFMQLNLSKNLPVYSKSLNLPPHIILEEGLVQNAIIADGSLINGTVIHSSIGYEVHIMKQAHIENCVILPNVTIHSGVRLKNVICNKFLTIPENFVFCPDEVTLLTEEMLQKGGGKDE